MRPIGQVGGTERPAKRAKRNQLVQYTYDVLRIAHSATRTLLRMLDLPRLSSPCVKRQLCLPSASSRCKAVRLTSKFEMFSFASHHRQGSYKKISTRFTCA